MSNKTLSKYQKIIIKHCKPAKLNWIEKALEELLYIPKTTKKTTNSFLKMKRQRNTQLEKVILQAVRNGYTNNDLAQALNIDMRTAQRYTRTLCKLRWMCKDGWYPFYNLNPFLRLMLFQYPKKVRQIVSKFVPYQVDLLKLFAYPLQLALKDKISNVQVIWSQTHPFGVHVPKAVYVHKGMYPYWNGIVQIKAEGKKQTYYSVLPYNIHWSGRNCHICLPIPFSFYGIESTMYVKGKATIHFDNSVIVSIPLGSASYTTRGLLHKYGCHHWSDRLRRFMLKYWKNEYAECFDFDTHEQILKDRLMSKKGLTKEITDKELIIQQFLA